MAQVIWHRNVEIDLGFGNAKRIVSRVGRDTKKIAKETAPRDTGELRAAIDFWQISGFPKSLGRIGVLNASINKGAGWRYLSKKSHPIRPTNADVLVMQHKGINLIVARGGVDLTRPQRTPFMRFRGKQGFVTTQYTTGYKANPFLVNAFKKACPYPVVEFPV